MKCQFLQVPYSQPKPSVFVTFVCACMYVHAGCVQLSLIISRQLYIIDTKQYSQVPRDYTWLLLMLLEAGKMLVCCHGDGMLQGPASTLFHCQGKFHVILLAAVLASKVTGIFVAQYSTGLLATSILPFSEYITVY